MQDCWRLYRIQNLLREAKGPKKNGSELYTGIVDVPKHTTIYDTKLIQTTNVEILANLFSAGLNPKFCQSKMYKTLKGNSSDKGFTTLQSTFVRKPVNTLEMAC